MASASIVKHAGTPAQDHLAATPDDHRPILCRVFLDDGGEQVQVIQARRVFQPAAAFQMAASAESGGRLDAVANA